jgi:murein DD-endopeptidase MepM/ murein hydrolase activator NlpD
VKRIEKTDVMRGAIIAFAILASSVLSGCADDPSPHTYLDWNTAQREVHPVAAHERNWPSATYYTVVVRPRDTVGSVAARYDVSESSVRRLNEIGPHNSIHAGDVLRIPPGPGSTRESVLHEVESPRIYAEPHDADYVEEHQLSPAVASATPVRVAHVAPHTVIAPHVAIAPAPVSHPVEAAFVPSGAMHFIWPVEGHVASGFGATTSGERNDGINIAASEGAPVRAAAAGTVTYAGNELRQYGNLVIIKHADGYITVYANEQSIGVTKGQQVAQGEVIGTAGSAGGADQAELHFEVRYQTRPVNPRALLSEAVARASS